MCDFPSFRAFYAAAYILLVVCLVCAQDSTPTNATSLPVGSCTTAIPCSNGACCNSQSGFCGFGAAFCTPINNGGTCSSNCNALAECGPDAAPENVTCPLNVCCSQFGFCGTTEEFCSTGCQSNCGSPSVPSCGVDEQTATFRRIGYYEGWAVTRGCMAYTPEQISAETLTHVNFAFALISSGFQIIEMSPGDSALWSRTTALKSKNSELKVFLSIGGWSFNDPPTSNLFSDLVASAGNTNTFIASALTIMESYGFDGLDIDWEYPAAYDRGGNPADKANYVAFMAAVKRAFAGPGYGLTFTAPSSYWYLQHFDLPGLLQYADWVNVMTYDLHGTWDGVDPYIGAVVEAHTNLTEIDLAFKLFWGVGVNPHQMVMGIGFYGRSFTLVSSDCSEPGCPWVSGASAGPCSANSGTLMYAEILSIIADENVQPALDPVAAVEAIVWDTNQWVSYDDAASFALKMNYANEHCIGGTMIWSVDQDDNNYSALQALYPNLGAAASGLTQGGGSCQVTSCGATSCGNGYTRVGGADTSPSLPGVRCDLLICCPNGDLPKSCTWRGGDTVPCNPNCNDGETLITTQSCGIGGAQAFCCETENDTRDSCIFEECTSISNPTCPHQWSLLTVGVRGQGSLQLLNDCTAENKVELAAKCPETCPSGQVKPFCCQSNNPPPVENCKWVGTLPMCLDNACATGQIQLAYDPVGDGTSACVGGRTRALCCDPTGNAFIPVEFFDVFPINATEGALTFDVEFDPDQGSSAGSEGAGTSSPMPTNEDEEQEAFGEVFIDSPNANAVSSLDFSSDWVIADCHPTSDQPQTVLAYCSNDMSSSESGCAHVFIGGAEHTIVKMPATCGRGPYARVASLRTTADQSLLSSYHQKAKPTDAQVYVLSFDYNFAVIPESNGPVYMRADVTDLPGYWDEIVDSPPERREWLRRREMEKPLTKRWWGTFTNWLNKLNTVTKDTSVSRNFHWSDTWNIYHSEISCPGPPQFDAHLDISVSGQAELNSRYGFYLQATVVPPSVQAAYLYFSSDASASAQFTVDAQAEVTYDSSTVQFASFGFPGLYYPGLLTIGPSLVVNGYITGHLSMQATLTTSINYNFPSVNFNLGKSGDQIGAVVSPSNNPSPPIMLNGGTSIEVEGDLSIHLVPQVQLGLSILGGAVIDAQAFIRTDMYAGVSINGSVSNVQAPQFCFDFYYGIDFDGGLTGSVLYWEPSPAVWNFYSNRFTALEQCWGSITEPTISTRSMDLHTFSFSVREGELESLGVSHAHSATLHEKHGGILLDHSREAESILDKRGAVPLIPGALNCPEINDQINTDGLGENDDPYSDLNTVTDLEDAFDKRDLYVADSRYQPRDIDAIMNITGDTSQTLTTSISGDTRPHDTETLANLTDFDPHSFVKVSTCNYRFAALSYDKAVTDICYDYANPMDIDPSVARYNIMTMQSMVPGSFQPYNREHIYEVQLLSMFMDWLALDAQSRALWDNGNANAFCNMILNDVRPNLVPTLRQCLPYNSRPANQQQPFMPWLDRVMNGLKAQAFNGQTLRNQRTFLRDGAAVMISILRAAVAVLEYMEDPPVREAFIEQSDCVKQAWLDWMGVWRNNPAAPASAQTFAIDVAYSRWIQGVVAQLSVNIRDKGIIPMLNYWDGTAITNNGQGVNAQYDFAFLIRRRNGRQTRFTTGTTLRNSLQPLVTVISWVARL